MYIYAYNECEYFKYVTSSHLSATISRCVPNYKII